jgi:hypothetical protein
MDKQVRRKILNILIAKVKTKRFFAKIESGPPAKTLPAATLLPAAYIARSTETPVWQTGKKKESTFRLALFAIVRSEEELEQIKADAQDELEEALNDVIQDADFEAVADYIDIDNVDPGPLSLANFGIPVEIEPPFGAIRIDASVIFDYTALT